MSSPRSPVTWLVALGLFLIWSNSFIAIGYLLGSEQRPQQLDWVALTVARFLPAAAICGAYCAVFRRAESLRLLRGHWRRLAVCAGLAVPGYNLALYYGQQHGVPAPVASLTTALVPLFVMLLAAAFLDERLTGRRVGGFLVSAAGMTLIALGGRDARAASYPGLIAITALAPLSWSVFSVLSKSPARRASPVVWTYLATAIGGLMVLPWLPGATWRQWRDLDAGGWIALLYLSVPCTVLGFALWTWLLRHLPATSVGFTVFLNPPLTTLSKSLLAVALPATFVFTIRGLEWVGGGVALLGLAIAVRPRRRGRPGNVFRGAGS